MAFEDNEGVVVSIVEFDRMENTEAAAIEEKDLATFVGIKDGLNSWGRAAKFISELKPRNLYLAYNNEVYPKVKIRQIHVQ